MVVLLVVEHFAVDGDDAVVGTGHALGDDHLLHGGPHLGLGGGPRGGGHARPVGRYGHRRRHLNLA